MNDDHRADLGPTNIQAALRVRVRGVDWYLFPSGPAGSSSDLKVVWQEEAQTLTIFEVSEVAAVSRGEDGAVVTPEPEN